MDNSRKLSYLLLPNFWTLLLKINVWRWDWPQACAPTQFWELFFLFKFSKIISLKLFDNSWKNPYRKVVILDFKFRFTCGWLILHRNTVIVKNIMSMNIGVKIINYWALFKKLLLHSLDFFHQKRLFLRVLKGIFLLNDTFSSSFLKNSYKFIKKCS